MVNSIAIFIPIANRLEIAWRCIPTVIDGMSEGDRLFICYDGAEDSRSFADAFPRKQIEEIRSPRIGIEAQRRKHFATLTPDSPFTHVYLTDADAIHDPAWRENLLAMQIRTGLPVCGYNTVAHTRLAGNTIVIGADHIIRRVAPGISYLLSAQHVFKVQRFLAGCSRPHWDWDWTVPSILGNRMLITRPSYVDHIGFGGIHHPQDEDWNGGDRATEPTPWLITRRKQIINELWPPNLR